MTTSSSQVDEAVALRATNGAGRTTVRRIVVDRTGIMTTNLRVTIG
jgi:hypothetical protein